MATSHYGKVPLPHLEFAAMAPAGGLKSSARDMCIFLSHNLGFAESELSSAINKTHQPNYRESELFGLGLGWHIQHRNDRTVLWRRGETLGQTSFIAFDPSEETGVVMLSNSALAGCCSDIAFAQFDPATSLVEHEPHDPLAASEKSLRQFEGDYAFDAAIVFSVSAEENHLSVSVTGQAGAKMYPVGDGQFETQDRRVIVVIRPDRKTLTIRQHGIDRVARKR